MGTAAIQGTRLDAAGAAKRYYFQAVFILLFALSLAAFWDNLVTDVSQASNSDPKMIVHAAFAALWMLTLVLQASLARTGNMRLHRKLGTAGFLAAAGVAASTAYLFVAVWKGWALMDAEAKANRLLLPAFAVFIVLGYRYRRRPEVHKRLVFTGTLFLLEPILARLYDPYLMPLLPPIDVGSRLDNALYLAYLFASWSAFYVSLVAYDLLLLKRVHPVSLTGFAMAIAINAFAYLS